MNYKALIKTFCVWGSGFAWFFGVPYWQAYTCTFDNRVFVGFWKGCTSAAEFGQTYAISILVHVGITIMVAVIIAVFFLLCMFIHDTYKHFS